MAEKNNIPISYKDPFYDELDARIEAEIGIPAGSLSTIRLAGEKTNADRVSPAGAKSVYQIIPSTRNALLKKYGVDAYESPENAARAAGYHLLESYKRSGGDPETMFREYHGGPNKKNWGKYNNEYAARTVAFFNERFNQTAPQAVEDTTQAIEPQQQEQQDILNQVRNTKYTPLKSYDEIIAKKKEESVDTSTKFENIYNKYINNEMKEEDSIKFENMVKTGKLILPDGYNLKQADDKNVVPVTLLDNYKNGVLPPEKKARFEQLVNDGILKLPKGQTLYGETSLVAQIPGGDPNAQPNAPKVEPTLKEQIIGAGETALTTGTGVVGGVVGSVKALGQIGKNILTGDFGTNEANKLVEQKMMEGVQDFTYQPRTEAGQEMTQTLGEVAAPLTALAGIGAIGATANSSRVGAPLTQAAIRQNTQRATQAVNQTIVQPTQRAAQAVNTRVVQPTQQVLSNVTGGIVPAPNRVNTPSVATTVPNATTAPNTPNIGGQQALPSVGAAGVPQRVLREQAAANLPVEVKLTAGQKTGDFEQVKKESNFQTLAGEKGAEFRDFTADQQDAVFKNFQFLQESIDDQVNVLDNTTFGTKINEVMSKKHKNSMNKVNIAYEQAMKDPSSKNIIDLTDFLDFLNKNKNSLTETDILKRISNELEGSKWIKKDKDGNFIKNKDMTVENAWETTKLINKFYEPKKGSDVHDAGLVKSLLHKEISAKGGDGFANANKIYREHKDFFESNKNLVKAFNFIKTHENKTPTEQIFNDIAKSDSSTLSKLKTMLTSDPNDTDSIELYKNFQVKMLQSIIYQTENKTVVTSKGTPTFKNSKFQDLLYNKDKGLDTTGKLDIIFEPKIANTLRDLSVVTKYMHETQKGAVNTSYSASFMTDMLMMMIGSPTAIATPLKFLSNKIKNRATEKEIDKAMGKLVNISRQQATSQSGVI